MAERETSTEAITLAFLCAAEARSVWQLTMPPLADLQHAPRAYDPATLRQSEITASIMSMVLGAAVSTIAKDKLPLLVTGLVVLTMVSAYESAIKRPGNPYGEWGTFTPGRSGVSDARSYRR